MARRHTPEQFNAPAENNFRIQIVYSTSYNTFIHSLIYPPKVKFRRTSKAAGDISTWKRKTFLPVCNIPTTHSYLPVFVPTLLQDHSSHNEINVQLLLQIIPTTEYKSTGCKFLSLSNNLRIYSEFNFISLIDEELIHIIDINATFNHHSVHQPASTTVQKQPGCNILPP